MAQVRVHLGVELHRGLCRGRGGGDGEAAEPAANSITGADSDIRSDSSPNFWADTSANAAPIASAGVARVGTAVAGAGGTVGSMASSMAQTATSLGAQLPGAAANAATATSAAVAPMAVLLASAYTAVLQAAAPLLAAIAAFLPNFADHLSDCARRLHHRSRLPQGDSRS